MAVGGGGVEALFYIGEITPGDVASWNAPGVLEDGGANGGGGVGWTLPAPTGYNDNGTAGQISYDSDGYFYLCYATNLWARFTGELIWGTPVSNPSLDFSRNTNGMYVPLLGAGI